MMRTVLPLMLAALAVSFLALTTSAAWAAGRPPRDTSVGCARADNQYCRMPGLPGLSGTYGAYGEAGDRAPGAVARQPLH
ncbi:hypothetical protein [Cupriavidus sp. D384]|uniref:hypothetical protein n=1 Tax=Cupriavidus sp. D384 TaxID=1538095 RepID=UPI000ADD8C56|nr:hypothetical protein [Cupriavidus sp. D384]